MIDYFPNDSKIPNLSDEEEKALFSDYASIRLAALKPFDDEDKRLLDNPLEFELENEAQTFEGERPPSLEEVEKRLNVDKLNLHHTNSNETAVYVQAHTQSALADTPIRDIRQAWHLSQEQLANLLHLELASISQLERSTDLYINMLRRYIESKGGKLDIIVHFPS
ncbi:MAG: XRE family transcriptional regulator [Candidatus Parabeggiatoa sp.]|nr:XRE family transcriptional regulator [Candidatus Parabeggiatoa sp.]